MVSHFDLCGPALLILISFIMQFVRMRRLRIKAARSSVKYERVERSYQIGELCGLQLASVPGLPLTCAF